MFVLLLLGRLSPRRRMITGVAFVVVGLAVVAGSAAVAADLLIHGAVLAAIGAVLWASAVVSRRRARPTSGSRGGDELTATGHPTGDRTAASVPVMPGGAGDRAGAGTPAA